MRLAVSNIAWRVEEAEAALDLLMAQGVPGLEIAPGLTFPGEPDPVRPSPSAVDAWTVGLERRGLTLVSMQSLLFGRAEAALFGDNDGRRAFETGLEAAIDLAARLDCPNLVLGSPAARRIPDGMDAATAEAIALEVIGRLGDRCSQVGSILSLEPNPAIYGTNFLNTWGETLAFVRTLDHPAVRLNLDIGALIVNGETDAAIDSLPQTIDRIGHVHISEPELAAAPADPAVLSLLLAALIRHGHDGWISIEMRSGDGDNLTTLRSSLARARAAFEANGADRP